MTLQQIKQRFEIIGNSPKLNYALETALRVAPTELTVYVQGESGVGKESFSKIIHQLSARKHGPFIAINAGALPEGTINSELFGHEKGAFTGALDTRKGYFETVNGGTIFLDEIGELPLETQSRLLRLLENGEFIRVGSSKVLKTDVRIITATNKDLLQLVNEGKFREDLYYRLATLPIRVPSLRERGSDVILLFLKFLSDAAEKYKIPMPELHPSAENMLVSYRWPGNIRQLKSVAEQLAILEGSELIQAENIKHFLPESNYSTLPVPFVNKSATSGDFSERDIFYKVLIDLKNDVADLKKVVLGIVSNPDLDNDFLRDNKAVITRVLAEVNDNETEDQLPKTPKMNVSNTSFIDDDIHQEDYVLETKDSVNTNENLSLDAKEEEFIRKALLKNNGRRKKAAKDLGISERTLYRKIKQYDIEE